MAQDLFEGKTTVKQEPIKIDKETGKITVGNKVFNSVEDLAKSKYEADNFIEVLKTEKQELAGKINLEQTVNTRMTQLEQLIKTDPVDANKVSDANQNTTTVRQTQVLDEGAISKVAAEAASRVINQAAIERRMEDNNNAVKSALIEACGSEGAARQAWEKYKASGDFDEEIHMAQLIKTPNVIVDSVRRYAENPTKNTLGFAPKSVGALQFSNKQPIRDGAKDAEVHNKNSRTYFSTEYQQSMMRDIASMKRDGTFQTYMDQRKSYVGKKSN